MPNYIRTHRRRIGMTQQELAYLLGCTNGAKVSRYERLIRRPDLETAFSCQSIFDVAAHELLPDIYAEVEQAVSKRAHRLAQRLRSRGNARHLRRKIAFLSTLASRRTRRPRTEL